MAVKDLLKKLQAGAALTLEQAAGILLPRLKKISRVITPKRILTVTAALASLLFVAVGYVLLAAEAPPLASFAKARLSLSQARHAEAEIYAPALMHAAEANWAQAAVQWEQESAKWRHQRRFRNALIATIKTARLADSAATVALVAKDSLQWLAATGISLVKEKIETLRAQFENLPVQSQLRSRFFQGELAILESELAFYREDYVHAAACYQQAAERVGSAGDEATRILRTYLANIPKWQKWAAETIAWSKAQQDIAIIVDKIAARSQVYKAGELLAEFPIELGPRWVGHKKLRGDKATPEGRYHVTKRKERERTVYYKALEINYPNDEDKTRFREAVARGELPRSAHIGGLIEIHGEGGKGANWTSGCVALRNDHMDEVYQLAKVGTPVTIVGSLKGLPALEETFQNLRKHTNGHTQR
jgi:lipoprotein-anchoring transpeptidase ErfK/SrfK